MSEMFNILATYCGINSEKQNNNGEITSKPYTSEPYVLEPYSSESVASEPVAPEPVAPEPVAPEPVACEPLESILMESRTIHHSFAVDNNETTIYYNCSEFKEKFDHLKKTNKINECDKLLHRTLSYKHLDEARKIIFEFLQSQTPNSMCIYGTSSWGMVGHGLYYDESKKLYGYYNGSFGITMYKMEKSFLENMYEDDDERLTKIRCTTFL